MVWCVDIFPEPHQRHCEWLTYWKSWVLQNQPPLAPQPPTSNASANSTAPMCIIIPQLQQILQHGQKQQVLAWRCQPQDDCCIGHGLSLNHRSCNGNFSQMHSGRDKICLCAKSCKVEKLDDILPSSLTSSRVVKVSCLYRNSIVLCYSFLGDRTLQTYSMLHCRRVC